MIRGDDNYVPVAKFPKAPKKDGFRRSSFTNAERPPDLVDHRRKRSSNIADKVDQFHAERRQSVIDRPPPPPPMGEIEPKNGEKSD